MEERPHQRCGGLRMGVKMTKEELEKEAIENVRNRFSICKNRNDDFILDNFGAEVEALVQFAELREKQIIELENENAGFKAQIEKMKCCQNCMHYRHFTKDITECAMSFVSAQNCRHNGFDKWEIKEK